MSEPVTISLDLAGERCALSGPVEVIAAVRLRYRGFVATQDEHATSRWALSASPAFRPDYAAPVTLSVRLEGTRLRYAGAVVGYADLESGAAQLDGLPDLGALDAALRAFVITRAPERDVIVMHGAMIVGEGGARVLLGASGAGKSTAAQALGAASDELVALRWDGARYTACATPYWGGRPAEAPLDTLVILERAEQTSCARLRGSTALRALFPHLVRYVERAPADRAALGLLGRLAEVPPWRLGLPSGEHFLPSLTSALVEIGCVA